MNQKPIHKVVTANTQGFLQQQPYIPQQAGTIKTTEVHVDTASIVAAINSLQKNASEAIPIQVHVTQDKLPIEVKIPDIKIPEPKITFIRNTENGGVVDQPESSLGVYLIIMAIIASPLIHDLVKYLVATH